MGSMRSVFGRIVLVIASAFLSAPGFAGEPTDTQPSDAEKATYILVPIKGAVGEDFTARQMQAHLDQAAKLKPTVVLLEIETPGGSVTEAEAIVDLIITHKELRFVALVKKALSAGATITLACKEIYMADTATMGAATSYLVDERDKPMLLSRELSEKHQSAWRAVCRKAAEHGGYPSVVAEAMVDSGFALTARKDGDKTVLEKNGQGEVIKPRGQILTLTAREAVSCHIALDRVGSLDDLSLRLGLGKQLESAVVGKHHEVAVKDVPNGANASAFCEAVSSTVAALRLHDRTLTGVQSQNAAQEWQAWLVRQKLSGKAVSWVVALNDAALDKKRSEGTINLTESDADLLDDSPLSSGYPVGSPPPPLSNVRYYKEASLEVGHKKLKTLEEILQKEKGKPYYQDRGGRTSGGPDIEGVKRLESGIIRVKELLGQMEAAAEYPVAFTALAGEGNGLLVSGWAHRSALESLAKVGKGEMITVTGTIVRLDTSPAKNRAIRVFVVLDRCSVKSIGATGEPAPAASGKEAAQQPNQEELAERRLNMAANLKRNGMEAKAREVLQSILKDFPDTKAAEKARKELEGPK